MSNEQEVPTLSPPGPIITTATIRIRIRQNIKRLLILIPSFGLELSTQVRENAARNNYKQCKTD